MSQLVFLDTSLVAEQSSVVISVLRKGGIPVISETVMGELNFMKDNRNQRYPKEVEVNARRFFNLLSRAVVKGCAMSSFPNGMSARESDSITRVPIEQGDVYLLSHQGGVIAGRTNDEKIIQSAKRYNGVLLTLDKAMSVIATSMQVQSMVPKLKSVRQKPLQRQARSGSRNVVAKEAFESVKQLKLMSETRLKVTTLPSQGAVVFGHKSGQRYVLGERIARGGEGEIFAVQGQSNRVAKVYLEDKLTRGRIDKLMLMTTHDLSSIKGMCWPVEVLMNEHYEPVGFVQPKAYGKTVFSALMSKPRLERNFPQWQRRDLVKVCKSFLQVVKALHERNVLMGDINPNNVLIDERGELYFVDTDSYQVAGYPCTVGTVKYTAPEIQGRSYDSFLRTQAHEMFAVATFIFMVLLPGKTPYAQQGGDSQAENIKAMRFPYTFDNQTTGKAPNGPWRFIWSSMPYGLKEVLFECFAQDKRPTIQVLSKEVNRYDYNLTQGKMNNALFPNTVKILDPVMTTCIQCGTQHEVSKKYLHKLVHEYRKKGSICPACREKREAKRFAQKCAGSVSKSSSSTPKADNLSWQQVKPTPPIARKNTETSYVKPIAQESCMSRSTSRTTSWYSDILRFFS